MDTYFFSHYWWLIFPIFGMAMGVFGMFNHRRNRVDTINLIKSYVDKGMEPPPALLDALRSDEDRAYGCSGRGRRNRGPWTQFVVFAALAAGFGFAYYSGVSPVFGALAFGFGVAAAAMLVMGLINIMTLPRDPQDKL